MEESELCSDTLADFENICRVCLNEVKNLRSVFDACLRDMLQHFTSIEVKPGDGLPDKLCPSCIIQCSKAYTFWMACRKSDSFFESYLDGKSKISCGNDLNKKVEAVDCTKNIIEAEKSEITPKSQIPKSVTDHKTQNVEIIKQLPVETVQVKSKVSKLIQINDIQSGQKLYEKCLKQLSESTSKPVNRSKKFLAPTEIKCQTCFKIFTKLKTLKRHEKTHSDIKPYKCDQCPVSFVDKSNLTKHKFSHTGELRNQVGKTHLCSFCGYSFKWRTSLSKHLKVHTRRNLFKCKYCDKEYVEGHSLRTHLLLHTGQRPYECSSCDKKFTQLSSLKVHRRIHTKEKPYKCTVCAKRQSGYLSVHMKKHTEEKSSKDQICSKVVIRKTMLLRHLTNKAECNDHQSMHETDESKIFIIQPFSFSE